MTITAVAILVTLLLPTKLAGQSARAPADQPVPSARTQQSPEEEDLAIIVNRSNPIDNLSYADVRKIFLGEQRHWPNGRKITLVMQDPGQPEREAALRLIYHMNERDLNRHFLQAAFTGEVQGGPKQLATADGVRRFVFNVPGAIGYARAAEVDESVKFVRVDGRAPGEPGYKIKLARRE